MVARALDDSIREIGRRAARARHRSARGWRRSSAGWPKASWSSTREGHVQLANLPRGGCCGCRTSRKAATTSRSSATRTSPRQISAALAGGEEGQSLELPLPHGVIVTVRSASVRTDRATGAVVVLHDITDLRRADRVRRDFVANVSHELRTPLTAVRGYVEALLDGGADGASSRRFLEIISRHTLRMERLVARPAAAGAARRGTGTARARRLHGQQPVRRRRVRSRRADGVETRRGRAGHRARRRRPCTAIPRRCTTSSATCSRTRSTTHPKTGRS